MAPSAIRPSVIRPSAPDDADSVGALLRRNRAFLQPWEPAREESWYTPAGQRVELARLLAEQEAGRAAPFLVLDGDEPVGQRINGRWQDHMLFQLLAD